MVDQARSAAIRAALARRDPLVLDRRTPGGRRVTRLEAALRRQLGHRLPDPQCLSVSAADAASSAVADRALATHAMQLSKAADRAMKALGLPTPGEAQPTLADHLRQIGEQNEEDMDTEEALTP